MIEGPEKLIVGLFLDGPAGGERGEVPPASEGFDVWRFAGGVYANYEWTEDRSGLRFTGRTATEAEMVEIVVAARRSGELDALGIHSDTRAYGADE